jgi:hypothetical protein
MAGRGVLSGTVFFTGGADEEDNKLPVPSPIVELWREVGKDWSLTTSTTRSRPGGPQRDSMQ